MFKSSFKLVALIVMVFISLGVNTQPSAAQTKQTIIFWGTPVSQSFSVPTDVVLLCKAFGMPIAENTSVVNGTSKTQTYSTHLCSSGAQIEYKDLTRLQIVPSVVMDISDPRASWDLPEGASSHYSSVVLIVPPHSGETLIRYADYTNRHKILQFNDDAAQQIVPLMEVVSVKRVPITYNSGGEPLIYVVNFMGGSQTLPPNQNSLVVCNVQCSVSRLNYQKVDDLHKEGWWESQIYWVNATPELPAYDNIIADQQHVYVTDNLCQANQAIEKLKQSYQDLTLDDSVAFTSADSLGLGGPMIGNITRFRQDYLQKKLDIRIPTNLTEAQFLDRFPDCSKQ